MDRIRKMINKKDGGMVKKFEEGGDVKKTTKLLSDNIIRKINRLFVGII